MKSKLSKIFTSALIAASLLCGAVSGKDNAGAMFSAVAFAAENSGECGASALWDFDSAHGILTISGTEEQGKLVLEYYSRDMLEGLYELLMRQN